MEIRHVTWAWPRLLTGAAALVALLGGDAVAQQPSMEDLKQVPASRQVTSVVYCRGHYTIGFSDGSTRKFEERDLRFGTDSSPLGPPAGRAVLVPTGRVGDRALVMFVGPAEMAASVRASC